MYSYNKNQDSPYDPTKLVNHFFCARLLNFCRIVVMFPNTRFLLKELCTLLMRNVSSFKDILIVVSLITLKNLQNSCRSTENRKDISRSCENPQCITSNDQHNCSFDEKHTFNIYLNAYYLSDMDPAALLSLNLTNYRQSLSNH